MKLYLSLRASRVDICTRVAYSSLHMEPTDAQLIAAYRSGDDAALNALVHRYLPLVYRFAYRLTGNVQDAEDVAQATFVKAWRYLKRYRSDASFKAWLFSIARNCAFDLLRKRRDITFSSFESADGDNALVDSVVDAEPLPDELVARAQDADALEAILNQLPLSQRTVLLLRYQEQLTFEEISKVVGQPLNTVKSHHRRGLIAIRKILSAPKS